MNSGPLDGKWGDPPAQYPTLDVDPSPHLGGCSVGEGPTESLRDPTYNRRCLTERCDSGLTPWGSSGKGDLMSRPLCEELESQTRPHFLLFCRPTQLSIRPFVEWLKGLYDVVESNTKPIKQTTQKELIIRTPKGGFSVFFSTLQYIRGQQKFFIIIEFSSFTLVVSTNISSLRTLVLPLHLFLMSRLKC